MYSRNVLKDVTIDYLEVHPVVLSGIALLLGPDSRPHLLRRHVEVQAGQVHWPKAGKDG